jgi:hypothetical protein
MLPSCGWAMASSMQLFLYQYGPAMAVLEGGSIIHGQLITCRGVQLE